MSKFSFIAASLFAAAAIHLAIVSAQDRAANAPFSGEDLDIPSTIGNYQQAGADIPQEEHIKELLQTSSILMRDYAAPSGQIIHLAVVHAANTRGSLHFPEVCLTGQGWEIDRQYLAPVGFLFSAKHLILISGEHKEAVLYWFKTGPHLTGSFFLNSWYWIKEKVMLKAPATTMIRISTTVTREGETSAFNELKDFATRLTPVLLSGENL